MSAIFGLIHWDGSSVPEGLIRKTDHALCPYASHDSQIFRDQNIAFGYKPNVLTAQDKFECQPYKSRDGRYLLVADAFLGERDRLLSKLSYSLKQGERLPDGQLIMDAFEKWGSDCTSHLLGQFTFVVFDTLKRKCFCVRDHCGEHTLHYFWSTNCFAFATMPQGLSILPEVGKNLNYNHLARYLVGADGGSDESWFEGIYEVPPGSIMRVDQAGMQCNPYWEVSLDEVSYGSVDDAAEQLLELANLAIKDRLRLEKPVGSFLSGGLDSSTISCLTARQLNSQGKSLPTFTFVPSANYEPHPIRNRFTNERPYVEAIAENQPGIATNFVQVDDRSLFHNLDDLLAHSGGLFIHGYYNRLWIEKILEQAQSQDIGALFNSQSGNFTMSWHGMFRFAELLRRGRWRRFVSELNAYARIHNCSAARLALSLGLQPLLPLSIWKMVRNLKSKPTSGNPFIRDRFLDSHEAGGYNRLEQQHQLGNDRKIRQHLLQIAFKRKAMIRNGYKALYKTTLQEPTIDKRLVEFSMRLSYDNFLRDGYDRYLMRYAAKNILPDSVRWNIKKGLQLPDWHLLFDNDIPVFRAHLDEFGRNTDLSQVLDLPAMQKALDLWLQDKSTAKKSGLVYRLHFAKAMVVGKLLANF